MKNQTIFELYTGDNKSKYSSNPMNILKSAIYIYIYTYIYIYIYIYVYIYETQHQVNFHSCYF